MKRRSFIGWLLSGVGVAVAQQKTAMEKGQAVVCEAQVLRCPLNHETCSSINATMVVGNENRSYPDSNVLFDYHFERCEVCHILFTRE